jgi:hypothetical protein
MLPFKKGPAGNLQLSGNATLLGGARKDCIDVAFWHFETSTDAASPSCCAECSKPHDPTDLAITDKIVRRTYFSRRNRLEHMGSSRNIGRGSRGGAAGTRDSCSARGERLSFSGATHRCLPRQFRRQRRARIRFRASSSSASHIYLVRNTTVSPRTGTYSPERASSPAPATEISCAGPDRFLRLHAASSTALPPLRESPRRCGCDARSPRFPVSCAR